MGNLIAYAEITWMRRKPAYPMRLPEEKRGVRTAPLPTMPLLGGAYTAFNVFDIQLVNVAYEVRPAGIKVEAAVRHLVDCFRFAPVLDGDAIDGAH